MIHNNKRYPTIQQELLLKAALLDGAEAIKAWDELKLNFYIDKLDRGSFRLLPLLYHNLHKLGINDKIVNELKAVHRYSWYNNQILVNLSAKLLESFQKNGIETMIIKGAAVAFKYYKDLGLRPINDIDVLVKPYNALNAIELLQKCGWRGRPIAPRSFSKNNLYTLHSWNFCDTLGRGFDLHWHLLPEFLSDEADNDYWNKREPFKNEKISTDIICQTDLLLHTCIQATRANKNIAPIRYLADIYIIVDFDASKIDWNRLIDKTIKLNMILPVRETLKYVKLAFNVPIPSKVLEHFENTNISKIDKAGFKARSHSRGLIGFIPSYWTLYLYQTLPKGDYSLSGFIRFLKNYWGLKHSWQIPLIIIHRGFKQLSGK